DYRHDHPPGFDSCIQVVDDAVPLALRHADLEHVADYRRHQQRDANPGEQPDRLLRNRERVHRQVLSVAASPASALSWRASRTTTLRAARTMASAASTSRARPDARAHAAAA